MKIKKHAAFLSCLAMAMLCSQAKAQTKASLFDGTLVAGYVDHGAYINCVGPNVKFTKKPLSISAGLLPSLRIKEDKVTPGATKNSLVTPIQLPFYYNTKTAAKNGEWNLGLGLGYKF